GDTTKPGFKPAVPEAGEKPTADKTKPGFKPVVPEAGEKPTADKPKPGEKPAKPGAGDKPDPNKTLTPKPDVPKPAGPSLPPRDEFVSFFRGAGGAEPNEFTHGIPQFLRRMNGEQ